MMRETTKVQEDFVRIAKKYALRNDVLYLRPTRMHLRINSRKTAAALRIGHDRLPRFERLYLPMERALYDKYEEYLLSYVEEHKVIPPSSLDYVRKTKTHRLWTLTRFLKLDMTPAQILQWKKYMTLASSYELAQMTGYSESVITACLTGRSYTKDIYETLKNLLNKLEAEALKGAQDYDNYY